jgi:hypothetical protein
MDLILIVTVLVLTYVVLNIRPSREGDMIFSLIPFIIGLFIAQEGMTWQSSTLTAVNTPMNFVVLAVMVLGGLMSLYMSIVDYRKPKKFGQTK